MKKNGSNSGRLVKLHLHSDDYDEMFPNGEEDFEALRRNRPQSLSECPVSRPCPHITCENHMLSMVNVSNGRRALKRLSEMPATCFRDFLFLKARRERPGQEDLTQAEIAEMMGITHDSLNSADERASRKLKFNQDAKVAYRTYGETRYEIDKRRGLVDEG